VSNLAVTLRLSPRKERVNGTAAANAAFEAPSKAAGDYGSSFGFFRYLGTNHTHAGRWDPTQRERPSPTSSLRFHTADLSAEGTEEADPFYFIVGRTTPLLES
jgi:hypothetical protein